MTTRSREDEPATAVFTRRVSAGREAEYEELAREMVAASERYSGHLAATMLHEPDTLDYTLAYSFANRPALQAWLDSDTRRRLSARAAAISDAHEKLQALTGLETWFMLPRRATVKPPPRWKMWLASLLALYPLVVCFQKWFTPLVKTWPLLARAAVFPLILLTLMTYVVMPQVTRMLRVWLYPEPSDGPRLITSGTEP
jgi:uncharacterized protein